MSTKPPVAGLFEPPRPAADTSPMAWTPKTVAVGAVLVIGGIVVFALTTQHVGAGFVALGAVVMMRGFRQSG